MRTGRELYGKLTASLTASHQLTVSYRHRPNQRRERRAQLRHGAERRHDDRQRQPDRDGGVGATSSRGRRSIERPVPVHEGEQRGRAGDRPRLPAAVQSAQSVARWASTPTRAGESAHGRRRSTPTSRTIAATKCAASISQFFDLGSTSHALKAGGGYEFGEEKLTRLANGWGSHRAASRRRRAGAAHALLHAAAAAARSGPHVLAVRAGRRRRSARGSSVNAGVLLNRDEFAQDVAGSGGCPATVDAEGRRGGVRVERRHAARFLRFGFGDEVQPRLGVSYQLRDGKGDKAYANWGRYYNMDQKSSGAQPGAEPHLPDADRVRSERRRPVERAAGVDDRQDDRSRRSSRSTPTRSLVGYATPLARALQPRRVFHVARHAQLHRGRAVAPERHGAGQRPVRRRESAVRRVCRLPVGRRAADLPGLHDRSRDGASSGRWMARCELHVEPLRRQLRSRLLARRRRCSTPRRSSRTARARTSRIRTDSVRCSRIGRTSSRCSARYAATDALTLSGYLRVQSGTPWAARGARLGRARC